MPLKVLGNAADAIAIGGLDLYLEYAMPPIQCVIMRADGPAELAKGNACKNLGPSDQAIVFTARQD